MKDSTFLDVLSATVGSIHFATWSQPQPEHSLYSSQPKLFTHKAHQAALGASLVPLVLLPAVPALKSPDEPVPDVSPVPFAPRVLVQVALKVVYSCRMSFPEELLESGEVSFDVVNACFASLGKCICHPPVQIANV